MINIIKVVNKYNHFEEEFGENVYIGRGSVLGNPYTHLHDLKLTKAKFTVATREDAIRRYEEYIREEIRKRNKDIIDELNRILDLVKEKRTVFLICFCKPKSCHGDILKELLKEKLRNKERF